MATLKISDILTRNVLTVSPQTTLSQASVHMAQQHISCLVATEEDKPIGILTEADLVRAEALALDALHLSIADFLSQPVFTIDTNMSIYEAFEFLSLHHVRHLVVVDEHGVLEGLITFTDLIKATEIDDFLVTKKIGSQMSRNVVTVEPQQPLLDALQSMSELHISCVVVVEHARALGIFTERDAAGLMAISADYQTLRVSDVMTSPLMTMHAEDSLLESANLMRRQNIRRIVIVDDAQHLVGILTQMDVIRGLEGRTIQYYREQYQSMEDRLQEKKMQYQTLFETSADAIMMLDKDGFTAVNASTLKLFHCASKDDFLGRHPAELSPAFQPCGTASHILANQHIQTALSQGSHHFEWRHQGCDGKIFPADVLLTRVDGLSQGLLQATVRDLTEEERKKQLRADQIRILSMVADMGCALDDILDVLIHATEAYVEGMKVSILFLDESGKHLVNGVAPSLPEAYVQAINGGAIGEHAGSCGSAAYLGERVIVSDIEHDVRWKDYKDVALAHGLRACWSEPVSAGVGNVIATLAMYYDEVREPLDADLEVIETMSALLAHAIMEKRAEQALSESHIYHTQAQRMAKLGHWHLDLISNRLRWSDEVYRIFEIDSAKFGASYEAFLDAIHPDDREMVNQTYLRSLETREPYAIEHRLLMADGRIKWVKEQCETEFNADAKPLRSLGLVQDITVQREQEKQLRLLKNAVNASNESVLITTVDGTIVYTNPAFTRMTGYEKDDVVGKTPAILHSGQQSKAFYRYFWDNLKHGKAWSGRILDRKADGTVFPVYLSVAPIFDEKSGELTHYVAVHEDLTQSEIFQKKMVATQKLEAVGIMAGGIAHDFNNLLAALTGNLYLMKMHNIGNEEIAKRTKVMESSIMLGAKMIQQMLTFARKDHVNMQSIDLRSFMKSVYKLAQASLPEDIEFVLNYDDDAWIHGDPSQLQQVILNLVVNAKHAVTDVEKPQITLSLNHEQPSPELLGEHAEMLTEQTWCCIHCSDNGCGMPQSSMEHIFEPFYTTREVGVGTGLGLSMVYGAVQNHRGLLDVQSKEGEGTSFSVYLPLLQVSQDKTVEKEVVCVEGRNRGVLLVDDNDNLRNVLVNVLRFNGFIVWEAEDGVLGVATYKKHAKNIDLVLMDIVMPNKGGITTAKEIIQLNENIPLIFLTAYGEEALRQAAASLQGVQTLEKPVDMQDLLEVIDASMNAADMD